MTGHKFQLKGFRINKKTGLPERIPNFGLNKSAQLKQRSSKRTRPMKRKP
jgi:hypothetical protein